MARIKFRDFSGGLHSTSQPDMQPRNTLVRMESMAAPVGGRLRYASPARVDYSLSALATFGRIDGLFRFNDIYFLEGSPIGTRKFLRQNAVNTDVWTVINPPFVNQVGT